MERTHTLHETWSTAIGAVRITVAQSTDIPTALAYDRRNHFARIMPIVQYISKKPTTKMAHVIELAELGSILFIPLCSFFIFNSKMSFL